MAYHVALYRIEIQNLLVNLESQSDIIVLGNLCNLNIFSKKSLATPGAVMSVVQGIKCAHLDNRLTKTVMTLYLHGVLNNCTMKSIVICCHWVVRVDKVCNNPVVYWLLLLFL